MIQRIIYKTKPKQLFDLDGGLCYLKMRGSIYFLKPRKYDSIAFLRKFVNYENKTPIEFYNIIHEDYLMWREKIYKTNERVNRY